MDNYSLSSLYTERGGGREGRGWFAKGSTHGYAETKPPLKMIKAKSVRQRVARFFLFHRVACLNVAVFVPCKCMHACMHECIHTRMHARLSPAIVPSVVFVRIRTPFPVPIPYLSFHSASHRKIPLRVNSTLYFLIDLFDENIYIYNSSHSCRILLLILSLSLFLC